MSELPPCYYTVAELRREFGVMFQDYAAYQVSAAENIGVGNVDRAEDITAITEAAARAGYALGDVQLFTVTKLEPALLPRDARVLDIPLDGARTLTVLYLVRTPEIDRLVAARGLKLHEIAAS